MFLYVVMNHNITALFIQQHTLIANLSTEDPTLIDAYILRALLLV